MKNFPGGLWRPNLDTDNAGTRFKLRQRPFAPIRPDCGFRLVVFQAADILVATKRMLYGEESWEAFLNNTTPTELDFVQQSLSNGMQMDSTKFDVESGKALYSFDLSAEGLLELLVRSLESTVITAGAESTSSQTVCPNLGTRVAPLCPYIPVAPVVKK